MEANTTTQLGSKPHTGLQASSKLRISETTSSIEATKDEVLADFINSDEFSKAVEYHKIQYKESYLESILSVANRLGMDAEYDAETIRSLIDSSLKDKLLLESIESKTVRGDYTIQIDM